jgi:hypothetical protein
MQLEPLQFGSFLGAFCCCICKACGWYYHKDEEWSGVKAGLHKLNVQLTHRSATYLTQHARCISLNMHAVLDTFHCAKLC